MERYKGYHPVIGLEVHVELATESKLFCACPTTFGAESNTQCCPVCMGFPGTLPTVNSRAVMLAIKAGLATECEIDDTLIFDRKQYAYPDLPKAFQISQFDRPLCKNGSVMIETSDGIKRVGITRIHVEEDAGKLIHGADQTKLDYNRSGVPLIEVVSEPVMYSAEEAAEYVRKLRSVLLYAGVSDCRMQEGSLRCDINLSVMKDGQNELGVRTEMKNLNSLTYIRKAIESEFRRQVDLLTGGSEIVQETRRYDPKNGKTICLRQKENTADYRFLPEYDLPHYRVSKQLVEELKLQLPLMPDVRKQHFANRYGLRAYDCGLLTESRQMADFFEMSAEMTKYPQVLCNLLLGEILRILPTDVTDADFTASHRYFASVATMMGDGTINSTTAKQLAVEVWTGDIDPVQAVIDRDLAQISDRKQLEKWVDEALAEMPTLKQDYRNGKTKALTALIGKTMAKSRGKANPVLLREIVLQAME